MASSEISIDLDIGLRYQTQINLDCYYFYDQNRKLIKKINKLNYRG